MKTLEECLTSDWYKEVIDELIKRKPHIKFTAHANYEAGFLMDSFKARKVVLEDLNSTPPTEEECIQWIKEQYNEH